MEDIKSRVETLIDLMVKSCQLCGLNLTVYEGKIGFVDQKQKKIVAVWAPQYTVENITGGE